MTYDPAKARAYYLRTRQLKGRRPTTAAVALPGRGGRRPVRPASGSAKVSPSSRQAELRAQKEALEKRLDRLQEVLREAVAQAKSRSGVKPPPKEAAAKTAEKSPAKKSASSKESGKKDAPLTTSEKREKARKAKEDYQKSGGGSSLSQDVTVLQRQVKDIRKKIEAALDDAQSGSSKPRSGAEPVVTSVRVDRKTTTDGPRGR